MKSMEREGFAFCRICSCVIDIICLFHAKWRKCFLFFVRNEAIQGTFIHTSYGISVFGMVHPFISDKNLRFMIFNVAPFVTTGDIVIGNNEDKFIIPVKTTYLTVFAFWNKDTSY